MIGAGVVWLLLADALKRQRQIPLHDGLDYEDYPELRDHSHAGLLGAPQRAIRHLSEAMRAKTATTKGTSDYLRAGAEDGASAPDDR